MNLTRMLLDRRCQNFVNNVIAQRVPIRVQQCNGIIVVGDHIVIQGMCDENKLDGICQPFIDGINAIPLVVCTEIFYHTRDN